MARHASAIKEVRKGGKRRARNLLHASHMKKAIKDFLRAVEQKDLARAKELLPKTVARILHTASRGVIHRNQANRRVSRLAHRLNGLSKAQEPARA